MDRRYKYDAFISYRHTELDKFEVMDTNSSEYTPVL